MPRGSRKKSETGIYHIMLRGSNRQEVFHDDEDCISFLRTLEKCKKKAEIKVYGWCLMGNHIHLLLEEGNEEISISMKRIGVSFVWYYNMKYETTGHLFQDRFKSENVETEEYLFTVIRYIHQNPVKARIINKVVEWKWSSCFDYYGNMSSFSGLLDSEFILKLFSEDKDIAIKRFKAFNEVPNDDECLDNMKRIRLTDKEAKEEIKKLLLELDIVEIKSLPKAERDKIIRKIKEIEGITQRQIARILGISRNLVFKA